MGFRLKKKKPIFPEEESARLVDAIRKAELQTSGEVRVFVERKCKYVDALDRAKQVFVSLKMEQTRLRNGVLFYLAINDRQLAVFADKGIHEAVGKEYWENIIEGLIATIRKEDLIKGLSNAIKEVGTALKSNFPYDAGTDKNELPDDIVFGD